MRHALVRLDGNFVPLIGIAYEACLMKCESCNQTYWLGDVELIGNKFICLYCKNKMKQIGYVGKYPLYYNAE
jgi:hypothetical protein